MIDFVRSVADEQPLGAKPQDEWSEATHPLLVAHLEYLRKLKGVHTHIDVLNENAHMMKALNHLCEHDYIFYLAITGQFDKLHEFLSDDKPEHEDLLKLVNEVQKEQAGLFPFRYLLSPPLPTLTSLRPKDWDEHMLEMQEYLAVQSTILYHYYHRDLVKLKRDYHLLQAHLFAEAVGIEWGYIEEAIKFCQELDFSTKDQKDECLKALNELKTRVEEKKKAYEEAKAHYEQSGDVKAAEAMHTAAEAYFEEAAQLSTVLREFKLPKELADIADRSEKHCNETRAQAAENEVEFEARKAELMEKMGDAHRGFVKGADGHLTKVIQVLDKDSEFKELADRVKTCREELYLTKDHDAAVSLLEKCVDELEQNEGRITAKIPNKKEKEVFQQSIQLLREVLVRDKEMQKTVESAPIVIEDPVVLEAIAEVAQIEAEAEKDELVFEEPDQDFDAMLLSGLEDSAIAVQESSPVEDKTHCYNFFRNSMKEMRVSSEEQVTLTDSQRQDYEEVLGQILGGLDLMKDNESIDQAKVQKLEDLINKMDLSNSDKVNASVLRDIYHIAKELGSNDVQMEIATETLPKIFDFLENSSTQLSCN